MRNLKPAAALTSVVIVSLAAQVLGAADPAESFYGERVLRYVYEQADAVVVGRVQSRGLTVVHGGRSQCRIEVDVGQVLKGKGVVPGSMVVVTAIAHAISEPAADAEPGKESVFFLRANMTTVAPWFSVCRPDPSMLWALKQLAADAAASGRRSRTD